jgi:hypothetical protein
MTLKLLETQGGISMKINQWKNPVGDKGKIYRGNE